MIDNNEKYIFFSYSHKDFDLLLPVIKALQEEYNLWYDDRIDPGSEWADFIFDKISNCSLFIFAITKNSLKSENCLDEITAARDLGKPFINLFIDDSELTGGLKLRLNRYQHFFLNEFQNKEEGIHTFVSKISTIAKDCKKIKENNEAPSFKVEDIPEYEPIREWALHQDYVSISKIQRECSVGFNRAGKIIHLLQLEGIISTESSGSNKGFKVIK